MPTPAALPAVPQTDEYDPLELPVAEEVAEETVTEPIPAAKPKHNPKHLAEALDYGYDMANVHAATPEALEEALRSTRKWVFEEHKRIRDQDARTDARPAPKPAEALIDPDELTEEEGFDPRLVALQKKNKLLEQRLGEIGSKVERREQASRDEMLDDAFEALGAEFAKIVGEGPAAELLEAKAMKTLARRGVIVRSANIQPTDTAKQITRKIKLATEMLYDAPAAAPATPAAPASIYDQIPATPGRELPGRDATGKFTKAEWEASALARPTHRNDGPTPPGRKLAIENLAQALKDQGSFTASGEAELDDFL